MSGALQRAVWLCGVYWVCAIGASAAAAQLTAPKPAPQRVVSVNLCTDELLLSLAAPEQIASVTWLAQDPTLSWFAPAAQRFPANRGRAEEILLLQADLVLAGAYSAPATLALLRRLQIPVVQVATPTDWASMQAQIRQVARALGRAAAGERQLAQMQRRLDALTPLPVRLTAAVYQPNGLTATAGSLAHTALDLAGLDNLAEQQSLPAFAPLALETLLLAQPDLLVLNGYEQKMPSLAQALMQHPVLQGLFATHRRVAVPAQSWSCGTVNFVRAVELLHAAAQRHLSHRVARR